MSLTSGYHQYMNSIEWYRKRERWLRLADYECQWCSRMQTTLYIHHLTYENFYNEKDEDIIVLCKPCHNHGDVIRKLLKGNKNNPLIQNLIQKRGYPFNMKLSSRKHVIKFKRKLKRTVNLINDLKELKPSEKRKALSYLENS